jgi:uncharacterized membrane protein
VVVALPALLLAPGYSLVAAFFPEPPRENDARNLGWAVGGPARVALASGFSLAIVSLVAYIWNFTPTGVQLWPVSLVTVAITLSFVVIAKFRRRRFPTRASAPSIREYFVLHTRAERLGAIVGVSALIVSSVLLSIAVTHVPEPERFSGVYLRGSDGSLDLGNLPYKSSAQLRYQLEIVNREHARGTYNVSTVVRSLTEQQNLTASGSAAPGRAVFDIKVEGDSTSRVNLTFPAPERAGRYEYVVTVKESQFGFGPTELRVFFTIGP